MNSNQSPVRWMLDHDAAQELAQVLCLLEDFLRHASYEAITEVADHSPVRPPDPSHWGDQLADYLGDQVIALHAATTASAVTAISAPATTLTGDPR